MLQRLKSNFGLSIIVSTPYMDEAVQCDSIALIQDGNFMTIDTPQGIVDSYDEELWAVRSDKMHLLLTDLRKIDGVKTAFAFGETHHTTIDKSRWSVDSLKAELERMGHEQVLVERAEASIEDCFMALMENVSNS